MKVSSDFTIKTLVLGFIVVWGLTDFTFTLAKSTPQQAGKIQEAVWTHLSAGQEEAAASVQAEINRILSGAPIDEEKTKPHDDLPGVTKSFRLFFIGSTESALFKFAGGDPKLGPVERELAAYRLSVALGFHLVPTVVMREFKIKGVKYNGSLMIWMEGASTAASAGLSGDLDKPDALRFFDAIVGNADRHTDNWMTTANGRIFAVDHNRTFYHDQERYWLDHLKEIKDPKSVVSSEAFSRLKALSQEEFYELTDAIKVDRTNAAWKVRARIIAILERSASIIGTRFTEMVAGEIVYFQLNVPIQTKNSEVEKVLRDIVLEHFEDQIRTGRVGLFSVQMRGLDGDTRSALGGLQVFTIDADKTRRLLIEKGFGVDPNP